MAQNLLETKKNNFYHFNVLYIFSLVEVCFVTMYDSTLLDYMDFDIETSYYRLGIFERFT